MDKTIQRKIMRNRKNIFLLIGPKGSGKSFVGMLFDQYFQITFLRVEDWAKEMKKDRGINNDSYIREVFEVIENGVRESLEILQAVVFESTGLTGHFDNMLKSLKANFNVITIKVNADKKLCLKRVKTRDQSIHINISDGQVNEINDAVLKKNWNADYEIENSNKTIDELKTEIKMLINGVDSGLQK